MKDREENRKNAGKDKILLYDVERRASCSRRFAAYAGAERQENAAKKGENGQDAGRIRKDVLENDEL